MILVGLVKELLVVGFCTEKSDGHIGKVRCQMAFMDCITIEINARFINSVLFVEQYFQYVRTY